MRLIINPGHLSSATLEILERRTARGGITGQRPMFNGGDSIETFFGEFSFSVDKFGELYRSDRKRLESALPADLVFLHLVALENGFSDLEINKAADRHPDLPWYGNGNEITDLGAMLAGQQPRLANRIARQLPEAGRIQAVSARDIREERITVTLVKDDVEPTPKASEDALSM